MSKRVKADRVFYILNIIIPIVLGTLLYICFRPDTYISKMICIFFGAKWQLKWLLDFMPYWMQGIVCNYLCDMLWAYAYVFSVTFVLGFESAGMFSIFILCSIFEILIEIFQKNGVIFGTFDILDIVLEVCVTAIGVALIKKHIRRNSNEEK